jgi:hypothetical protein
MTRDDREVLDMLVTAVGHLSHSLAHVQEALEGLLAGDTPSRPKLILMQGALDAATAPSDGDLPCLAPGS